MDNDQIQATFNRGMVFLSLAGATIQLSSCWSTQWCANNKNRNIREIMGQINAEKENSKTKLKTMSKMRLEFLEYSQSI